MCVVGGGMGGGGLANEAFDKAISNFGQLTQLQTALNGKIYCVVDPGDLELLGTIVGFN